MLKTSNGARSGKAVCIQRHDIAQCVGPYVSSSGLLCNETRSEADFQFAICNPSSIAVVSRMLRYFGLALVITSIRETGYFNGSWVG